MLLKPEDHEKVRAAVEAAEAKTAGEIICVIAPRSSDYGEVPLAWATAAALIVPAVGLLFGFHPAVVMKLFDKWAMAAAVGEAAVVQALTGYVIVQAALFLATLLLASIPAVHRLITPRILKRDRARRHARRLFAAQGLHLTEGRTGVLIFASLAERSAEVIADVGIAAKVGPAAWSPVAEALVRGMKAGDPGAGFAGAVERASGLLAQHFPRRPDDKNELPDTVIELQD